MLAIPTIGPMTAPAIHSREGLGAGAEAILDCVLAGIELASCCEGGAAAVLVEGDVVAVIVDKDVADRISLRIWLLYLSKNSLHVEVDNTFR